MGHSWLSGEVIAGVQKFLDLSSQGDKISGCSHCPVLCTGTFHSRAAFDSSGSLKICGVLKEYGNEGQDGGKSF